MTGSCKVKERINMVNLCGEIIADEMFKSKLSIIPPVRNEPPVKGKYDVNTRNSEGWTLLHSAAQNGLTETVTALIKAGRDVNAKDNDGRTPLHIASRNGLTAIVIALIKAGADVNAKDNRGWTPLHLASFCVQTNIIKILIEAGANENSKDRDGCTPLSLASIRCYKKIVNILKKKPALNTDKQKYQDAVVLWNDYNRINRLKLKWIRYPRIELDRWLASLSLQKKNGDE